MTGPYAEEIGVIWSELEVDIADYHTEVTESVAKVGIARVEMKSEALWDVEQAAIL
jgi:hypothetical protein